MNTSQNSFVIKFNLGIWAVRIETYIFSACYFYYAISNLILFLKEPKALFHAFNAIFQKRSSVDQFLEFNTSFFLFLMIFFNALIALGLISRKNLKESPDNLQEIVIPLIATFHLLSFNVIQLLPPESNILIIPRHIIPLTSVIGALISTSGIVISMLALIQLRRSFGILVQVRSIIFTGLYKHVRHPMYLGYFLVLIGLSLSAGEFYHFLSVGISMLVFTYRAKLEENKLARYSEEYRAYMAKTPGIWPRLKLN